MTSPSREERVAHLIECQRVAKTYGQEGENVVPIFDDLALSIESGEFLSIVGPQVQVRAHCFT